MQDVSKYLIEAPLSQNSEVHGRSTPEHEPGEHKRQQPNITKAEAERIAQRYKAGKSTKQLAAELGRSRGAISESLKRSGVEMRTFRQSSPEEIKQMVALYESGLSLVRVAERVGFSHKTVWTQLRNAGATMRSA